MKRPVTKEMSTAQWRALESPDDVADALVGLYERRGAGNYDEVLSQTEHALQSGQLAMAADVPVELIVAAFLHDVGHLLMAEQVEASKDLHHEDIGGRFLSNWFPDGVTSPIRLHVAAKRYLCRVEPTYADGLSAGSTRSLGLQGGPMSVAEVPEFEAIPGWEGAVELRRWDDLAKVPGAPTPDLAAFRELLVSVMSTTD